VCVRACLEAACMHTLRADTFKRAAVPRFDVKTCSFLGELCTTDLRPGFKTILVHEKSKMVSLGAWATKRFVPRFQQRAYEAD
jgi:hypothetical protein